MGPRWAYVLAVPMMAWALVSAREGRPIGVALPQAELSALGPLIERISLEKGIPPELLATTIYLERPAVTLRNETVDLWWRDMGGSHSLGPAQIRVCESDRDSHWHVESVYRRWREFASANQVEDPRIHRAEEACYADAQGAGCHFERRRAVYAAMNRPEFFLREAAEHLRRNALTYVNQYSERHQDHRPYVRVPVLSDEELALSAHLYNQEHLRGPVTREEIEERALAEGRSKAFLEALPTVRALMGLGP